MACGLTTPFFRFNETSPYLIKTPHLINPYVVIATFNIVMSISGVRGPSWRFSTRCFVPLPYAPKSRDYEWLASPFRYDIMLEKSVIDSNSSIGAVGWPINCIGGWIEHTHCWWLHRALTTTPTTQSVQVKPSKTTYYYCQWEPKCSADILLKHPFQYGRCKRLITLTLLVDK